MLMWYLEVQIHFIHGQCYENTCKVAFLVCACVYAFFLGFFFVGYPSLCLELFGMDAMVMIMGMTQVCEKHSGHYSYDLMLNSCLLHATKIDCVGCAFYLLASKRVWLYDWACTDWKTF